MKIEICIIMLNVTYQCEYVTISFLLNKRPEKKFFQTIDYCSSWADALKRIEFDQCNLNVRFKMCASFATNEVKTNKNFMETWNFIVLGRDTVYRKKTKRFIYCI